MPKLRYAAAPVVSAIRGIALGGGCEMAVYSAKRVAAMESYIGLVEVGVGLVPGARRPDLYRAPRRRERRHFDQQGHPALPDRRLHGRGHGQGRHQRDFESRKIGYLLDSDVIVPNKDELLFLALNEARALFIWATARRTSASSRGGPQRLGHHQGPARQHARRRLYQRPRLPHRRPDRGVVCGGDVDAGTLVTEEYLMTLERKAFCSLLEHPKTQERIMGMMSTGKPVRN